MADKRPLSQRLRRLYRRRQRQVEGLGVQAGEGLDTHIINRLERLVQVRRFVAVWVGLLLFIAAVLVLQLRALSSFYQVPAFVPGGNYTEGILGDFTTANPLYATGPVDTAVSHLLFASLLTYDNNNQLSGELAKSWQVDPTDRIYTVQLKPGLSWQDGQPLTASDVVFTYHLIQDPNVGSPLSTSWQNVTVTALNPTTIRFSLSNPLASFPYSLTNGIVPEHRLGSIAPSNLRSANFNSVDPIGSGPFAWKQLAVAGDSPTTRQEEITLLPFNHYANGSPKLDSFIIRAFHDQGQLANSFSNHELTGEAGLTSVPKSLGKANWVQSYSSPLTAATMVFFKNDSGLLADQSIRQALVAGADVNTIISELGYPVIPVREPFLANQFSYNPNFAQQGFSASTAEQLLSSDGWVVGSGGLRQKSRQTLSFKLYAEDTPEDRLVTGALNKNWRAIGVNAQVVLEDSVTFQDTVTFHNYDALLYGISIGVDPDVFVYWGSSQADPRSLTALNFSEYQSSAATSSLEAGRTRSDQLLRTIKYRPFLAAWQQAAPALGLYQPRFLYLTKQPVSGLSEHSLNEATDRYDNVQNWEIQQAKVSV